MEPPVDPKPEGNGKTRAEESKGSGTQESAGGIKGLLFNAKKVFGRFSLPLQCDLCV